MSEIKVQDGAGSSITLHEVDGYHICTFLRSPEGTAAMFRDLADFKCREDDVTICAPVKSGTHWTWEIIYMLYNGKAETIPKTKVENMLEAMPFDALEELPSPRLLNTHLHYKLLPREMKEKRCKLVYVLRNPKDVAVSLYNHVKGIKMFNYDGQFEHFLPLFLQGKTEYNSWFEYVLEWETLMSKNPDLPIHLIYYEDLKENNLKEIIRLGKFLGIENKDGLFEAVSQKCNIKNMRKDKEPSGAAIKDAFFKDGYTMFRKGGIGDWKNWFTVAQNECFDDVYDEKMKSSKQKIVYTHRL